MFCLSLYNTGLFKRAIFQSGSALCPWAMGGAHAEVAEFTGNYFNCTSEHGSEEMIKCLQEVDVNQLLTVQPHLAVIIESVYCTPKFL